MGRLLGGWNLIGLAGCVRAAHPSMTIHVIWLLHQNPPMFVKRISGNIWSPQPVPPVVVQN
jgi:hypothetical protein